MSVVFITQRVEEHKAYKERRDCLDQAWYPLMEKAGLEVVIVPNRLSIVKKMVERYNEFGLLLTGGNTLSHLGGDAPERDEVELFLLTLAIEKKMPVLGICRGMQVIQHFYHEKLIQVSGHVAKRHNLEMKLGRLSHYYELFLDVNSYHNFGSFEVNSAELNTTSVSNDNVIMSLEHKTLEVYGQMWHPEREMPLSEVDVKILKNIFKGIKK